MRVQSKWCGHWHTVRAHSVEGRKCQAVNKWKQRSRILPCHCEFTIVAILSGHFKWISFIINTLSKTSNILPRWQKISARHVCPSFIRCLYLFPNLCLVNANRGLCAAPLVAAFQYRQLSWLSSRMSMHSEPPSCHINQYSLCLCSCYVLTGASVSLHSFLRCFHGELIWEDVVMVAPKLFWNVIGHLLPWYQ